MDICIHIHKLLLSEALFEGLADITIDVEFYDIKLFSVTVSDTHSAAESSSTDKAAEYAYTIAIDKDLSTLTHPAGPLLIRISLTPYDAAVPLGVTPELSALVSRALRSTKEEDSDLSFVLRHARTTNEIADSFLNLERILNDQTVNPIRDWDLADAVVFRG